VNPALIRDPGSVASAGAAGATGDGSAALRLARLRTEPVMLGLTRSFDAYFADVVTEIGLKGEAAQQALLTESKVLQELKNLRESLSGVNLDEELANMIKFQHGYAAAARFITEFDRMIDLIINRMGV
jgi:flagellar hook-associated protein 1 FlgK